MTDEVVGTSPRTNLFHRLRPVLKWLLFALVIAFIGHQAWQLWRDGDVSSVTIHWPWLLAAGALYLVGWLPSVLFWHRLIHEFGGSSSRWDVARSYFAGHLAKYIPGKASVLLIRMELLADRGCRRGLSALTSTYEVLVCMGVGAAVGLTLAPIVWPSALIDRLPTVIRPAFDHPLIFGICVVAICVALVPFLARVLGLIARKLTPPAAVLSAVDPVSVSETNLLNERPTIQIGGAFLLGWCFLSVTTWLIHGLSLGCTLRAVGVSISLDDWLIWTGDVSSASFLGFAAVFAPGGLGVREGVLFELLKNQPGIDKTQAFAAAGLLRGAWLAAEIVATVGLGWKVRR